MTHTSDNDHKGATTPNANSSYCDSFAIINRDPSEVSHGELHAPLKSHPLRSWISSADEAYRTVDRVDPRRVEDGGLLPRFHRGRPAGDRGAVAPAPMAAGIVASDVRGVGRGRDGLDGFRSL
ncbi:hypothetical protein PV04_02997 [Phialophora macrospora]|uniref:Uncharacterized protein n=1 Tax=Phialophora macrospora TaxID=1851006 RepID=A0A0D2CZR6_9EURO|nr:hypothetical protein PV04_02997 [Phialophora macrospora]